MPKIDWLNKGYLVIRILFLVLHLNYLYSLEQHFQMILNQNIYYSEQNFLVLG